jgi:hypothetical protein
MARNVAAWPRTRVRAVTAHPAVQRDQAEAFPGENPKDSDDRQLG